MQAMEIVEQYYEKNSGVTHLEGAAKTLYVCSAFAVAMSEGVICDYFFNEAGMAADALLTSLNELGIHDVAAIITKALAALQEPLPATLDARQVFIDELDDEIVDLWDELTEDYYDIENDYWTVLAVKIKAQK